MAINWPASTGGKGNEGVSTLMQRLDDSIGYVEQVSPHSQQVFARLLTERSMGTAAFSASAALLLMRVLRQMDAAGATGADPENPGR